MEVATTLIESFHVTEVCDSNSNHQKPGDSKDTVTTNHSDTITQAHDPGIRTADNLNGTGNEHNQDDQGPRFDSEDDHTNTGQSDKTKRHVSFDEQKDTATHKAIDVEPQSADPAKAYKEIPSRFDPKEKEGDHISQEPIGSIKSMVQPEELAGGDETLERRQAWTEPQRTEAEIDRDRKDCESGEERIRYLLAFMEEEKRLRKENGWVVMSGPLEDIQEADEESTKLSIDSRPSSRPISARSRPPSARSRPPSVLSRSTGTTEAGEMVDALNTVNDESWYMPVRPPSVLNKNLAAGITLESGGKYRISLPSDTEKCAVSALSFLESGHLVLTDSGNQKVKFVDKDFAFISQYPMTQPWAVCSVDNDIYVTNGTYTIQHLFVKDMVLEVGKSFKMNGQCFGIANFNNGIAVGLKSSEIQLMNTLGEVKRIIKIPKTEKGKQLCPRHLCVTPKYDILVTDSEAKIVYCLNSSGELLWRYHGMSNPFATVSDLDGNIFLVGLNKDTDLVMQILIKEGEGVMCVKSVLQKQDVEFEPHSICFRKSDGLLVLAGIRHALKRYRIV